MQRHLTIALIAIAASLAAEQLVSAKPPSPEEALRREAFIQELKASLARGGGWSGQAGNGHTADGG